MADERMAVGYQALAMSMLRRAALYEQARDADAARMWRSEAATMLRLAAIWARG